jgi:hypothetical protein
LRFKLLPFANGRDFFSFCPIFFCFFSIAFFTARFPPSAASASYLARTRNSFFSAAMEMGQRRLSVKRMNIHSFIHHPALPSFRFARSVSFNFVKAS